MMRNKTIIILIIITTTLATGFTRIEDRYYGTFSHHYQGSIDFNTVNIQRTKGMYFLVYIDNYD